MADMLHNKTKTRAATILLLASEPAIRNVIRKVLESEQILFSALAIWAAQWSF